jgi:hypothetical protein
MGLFFGRKTKLSIDAAKNDIFELCGGMVEPPLADGGWIGQSLEIQGSSWNLVATNEGINE